MREDEIFSPVK